MKQLAVILLFMACFVESRASGALADDSLYCFRFVRGKGMFYVPYKGNGQALERLMVLIGMHREDILSGNIPVFVEGFCPDRKTARERSNRVKSEMILRGGLHEACFRTVNHVQEGDYVEVRLRLPAAPQASEQADDADAVSETENMPHDIDTTHCAADTAVVPAASLSASPLGSQPDKDGRHDFGSAFALRTNLLRLATLTADFGLEYRLADARIAILLNALMPTGAGKRNNAATKSGVSPPKHAFISAPAAAAFWEPCTTGAVSTTNWMLRARPATIRAEALRAVTACPSPVIGLSTSMPPQAILVPNTTNTPASGR